MYAIRSYYARKPYWVYGAVGYSLIGASLGMYFSASSNYNSYLSANTIAGKDKFYNKAVFNRNLSYAFLGAAGVVWAIDYIGLVKRKREIKKTCVITSYSIHYTKLYECYHC